MAVGGQLIRARSQAIARPARKMGRTAGIDLYVQARSEADIGDVQRRHGALRAEGSASPLSAPVHDGTGSQGDGRRRCLLVRGRSVAPAARSRDARARPATARELLSDLAV